MSSQKLARQGRKDARTERIVNDFSIQVATVNGSGSQSSNNVLMRSIFKMGIPVSGKNLFPSNIAGLPTWFTIRANKDGYIAPKTEVDLLIAMNTQTAREDVAGLASGAAVVYEEALKLDRLRSDLIFYPVPFAELAKSVVPEAKLRKLLANMIYVGVVGHLLSMDKDLVYEAIVKQFKSKSKAIELNRKAVDIGFEYAEENLTKTDPLVLERMDDTQGKILIDGNTAGALGSMFGGVTVVTWYPITPSSSVCEQLGHFMSKYRVDPETGKATYAIVQAEDELAAVGMAIGAGWAGARSMTATSGPGISLMSEFVGLGYYAEIPAVIWNVQRVGPSTGLPTRTAQGDIISTYLLSHGDTKHIALIPSSVEECFEFGAEAFNLAERFQTPVFVLSDLDLGMNIWMSDPFTYPEKPLDRGKVLTSEDLDRVGEFARYRDVDGDGIPYRTLPGTYHHLAAYFSRGSGHNEYAGYSERPDEYKNNMDRLSRKFDTARSCVPAPEILGDEDAEVGVVAFGTSHWAVVESRDQLEAEANVKTRYLRLKALPFTKDLEGFVRSCKRVYVVEQNRDAQMAQLIRLEFAEKAELSAKIRSVLHYTGIPLDARFVTDEILAAEKAVT
jgi:2-oxoglutarate ferredoxin oxidoreductase subunit alpha